MFECEDVYRAVNDEEADPRMTEATIRGFPRTTDLGTLVLVGVVHDHPASVARVATLLDRFTPETLALELPPLSIPLFRQYARDEYTPPCLGGEMSAAIQSVESGAVVGIDAPNRRYVRELLRTLGGDDEARAVTRPVLRDLGRSVLHALTCRLGAVVAASTPLTPRLYRHIPYRVSMLDPPDEQAAHERSHVAQFDAFVGSVDTPPETALVDRIREAVMAERIERLRRDGDVVCVVGMSHLDALERRLRSSEERDTV